MDSMFKWAFSFNQLVHFDTQRVQKFGDMFYNAKAFDQSIAHFDMSSMWYFSDMSVWTKAWSRSSVGGKQETFPT